MKASDQIESVLTGVTDFKDAQSGIQMACCLFFYQGACEVLKGKDKAARQAKLARIPEKVRPYIEIEVKRLWKLRGR